MIISKTFEQLSGREVFEILKARQAVFIIEQTCIYPDIDDQDLEAVHLLMKEEQDAKQGDQSLRQNGKVGIQAYLRILWKDPSQKMIQLGRVLTVERGKGYGAEILAEGIRYAREVMKAEKIYIEAQEYAIGFYEREGFQVCSDVFLEDGIPHVKMIL